MVRRTLAALLVVTIASAQPAAANPHPHKVLVMQAEGRADASTLTRIDAALLKLVKANEAQVTAGDITYADAAAAVGCRPEDRACKDEVLGMLAIDEIVFTTVTPKPGGLEIVVHRVTKGTASRDAQMCPPDNPPNQLEGIAPLFRRRRDRDRHAPGTGRAPPRPRPFRRPRPPNRRSRPQRGHCLDQSSASRWWLRQSSRATNRPMAPPGGTSSSSSGWSAAARWCSPASSCGARRAGSRATSTRRQTGRTPTSSTCHLLEQRGDSVAAVGNVLFLGGLIVGGVSGYYYWKDRRAQRSLAARITPTVFDHGAGLAFCIGGSP